MSKIKNAGFIRQDADLGDNCPVFFKEFDLDKEVSSAVISVSCLGVYEAYINGKRVGDFFLAPGWTSYETRLQYQTYDISDFLIKGKNKVEICAGVGERFHKRKNEELDCLKSDEYAVIASIEINCRDGSKYDIFTDSSWKAKKTKILFSSVYDGETYDYTFEDEKIYDVKEIPVSKDILLFQEGETARVKSRVAPHKLIITPEGDRMIDFGQEVTGYVEWKVPAEKGREYKLYHSEFNDKNGNFYNANLRSAKELITVVSDGEEHIYRPHFTYQGFRYIKLEGFSDDEINLDNFTACAVFSDMKRTGRFQCGDKLVQQLYENAVWGQRGNFLDVPTDCPQRDERMGWTGDAQIFAKTASINYDTDKFYTKWLHDMAADQDDEGAIPHVVPAGWDGYGSAAWGDSVVIIPYRMYCAFGDEDIIRDMFPSMRKWLGFIRKNCSEKYIWSESHQFGDWVALDGGKVDSSEGLTDKSLIATAYYAYDVGIMIKMGKVIGEDVSDLEKIYPEIKKAFNEKFLSSDRPEYTTQTACCLAINFDLSYKPEREAAILVTDILSCGHLKTGFVGTPILLPTLEKIGRADIAFALLTRKEYPSWLYPVLKGATTIWERWNGIHEDGEFADVGMNSFNHYAYGSVAEWMYTGIAGINYDEDCPAYKHVIFRPHFSAELGFAKARIDTRSGVVTSYWKFIDDNTVRYECSVPAGVKAELYLNGERIDLEPGEFVKIFSLK